MLDIKQDQKRAPHKGQLYSRLSAHAVITKEVMGPAEEVEGR